MYKVGLFFVKYLGAMLVKLMGMFWRYEIINKNHNDRVLYLFWHRNILPLLYLRRGEGVGVMISSSKDGDYVAEPAKVLGFRPIRGSITRGGAKAAREMIKFARENSICIVPDGPKGPACKIKNGAGIVALLSGLPIIPAVVHIDREWVFNSWDRFRLPKPFAKIYVEYGKEYKIDDKKKISEVLTEIEADMSKTLEKYSTK